MEDLIRLWKPQHPIAVNDTSESVSPSKKKRLQTKLTNKSDKPRKASKDKARQKSVDASSALAAKEIISFTQYQSVFPAASSTQRQELQHLQPEDVLFDARPQQPQQLLQLPNTLLQQKQHQRQ